MTNALIEIIVNFQTHGQVTLFRKELLSVITNSTNIELMEFTIKLNKNLQRD